MGKGTLIRTVEIFETHPDVFATVGSIAHDARTSEAMEVNDFYGFLQGLCFPDVAERHSSAYNILAVNITAC